MKAARQKRVAAIPMDSFRGVVDGQKAIFQHDLAELYGIETSLLIQTVTRNRDWVFNQKPIQHLGSLVDRQAQR